MTDENKAEPAPATDNRLTVITRPPSELYRQATDVAAVCSDIVKRTAVKIRDKAYIKVEGWEAIAAAHGCHAGADSAERAYDNAGNHIGYVAKGYIRTNRGEIIATGDGFVGFDEKDRNGNATWKQRAEYAGRAMAQTRAISRACRSVFAHVVVLIDEKMSTTPAEEMPRDDEPPHDRAGKKTPLKKPDDDAGRMSAVASLRAFIEKHHMPEAFLMELCFQGNLADGSEEKIEDLKDGVLQRFGSEKMRQAVLDRWKAKQEALAKASSSAAVAAAEIAPDENVGRSEWKRPMTTLKSNAPQKCLEMINYKRWQDVPVIRGANKDILLGDLTPAQLRHYINRWTPTKDEDGGYEDAEIVMDAALTLAAQVE
jgi:hypothetical protein